MERRWDTHPIVRAGLFGVYVLVGKLSLHLAVFNISASAFWPPAGLALAALVLVGWGLWPAIALAAFVVNVTTTGVVWTSIIIAAGNTLEALAGAWLINRFAGGRFAFQTAESVFRSAALLGVFSTTLSATIGVSTLALAGLADWTDYSYVWMTWWLGDLTGDLVVLPFLLLWAAGPWRPIRTVRPLPVLEAIGLLFCLIVVGVFVFGGFYPSDIKNYPLDFLCGPFLLWAAFRFGRREVATAVLLLSTIAVWGTVHHYGPFAVGTPNESLVLLQIYTSVTAIIGVALAAVVAGQKAAEARLIELATVDSLTGLANYRRLMDVLRAEITRCDRTGRQFSILFLDVDGLKKINDRYGHLAGSRALCQVAQVLRESSRSTDTVARYGGDEFAVVLAETAREGAKRALARVTQRLAELPGKPTVSVSAGVALYPDDGATPALLIGHADEVLYTVKGRQPAVRTRKGTRVETEPLPDLFSAPSATRGPSTR